MCIETKYRTLTDSTAMEMYAFFVTDGVCTKYVTNDDFQSCLQELDSKENVRSDAPYRRKAFGDLISSVQDFAESYGWQAKLTKLAVTKGLVALEKSGFLRRVRESDIVNVCIAQFYYHLGMIALDAAHVPAS